MNSFKIWIARLIASCAKGFFHAGLLVAGMIGANKLDVTVPMINLHAFFWMCSISAGYELFKFMDFSMTEFLKTNKLPTNGDVPDQKQL